VTRLLKWEFGERGNTRRCELLTHRVTAVTGNHAWRQRPFCYHELAQCIGNLVTDPPEHFPPLSFRCCRRIVKAPVQKKEKGSE
jgi:hypothetical protein